MSRKDAARNLLERFAQANGPSGTEDAVRRIIQAELGAGVSSDGMGNVFFEKQGTGACPRVLLAAHMDEVGLIVHSIGKDGLIRFAPLGGWWSHTLLSQRVRILTQQGREILGVIGAKPPHFLTSEERERLMKIDDMFIDIGTASAAEAAGLGVQVGDAIVPESPFAELANPDYLLSKAFDDRAGLALMVQVIKELNAAHPNTVIAAATVQEEVGARGAATVNARAAADVAIILEGTPADDLPGAPEEQRQAVLGKGVQIRILDASAIMNRNLVQYCIDTAINRGIHYQTAVRKSGGTDAGRVHMQGRGIPSVVLGVPARYIHTHNSVLFMPDYLAALELVMELVQGLNQTKVEELTKYL